jgi:hypothetical protein
MMAQSRDSQTSLEVQTLPTHCQLTGEQQRELDRICDAFEFAYRELGEIPQWHKFLAFGSRAIQPQLAYELIRLDQFYSRLRGNVRTLQQYIEQCGQFGQMIHAAIRDESKSISDTEL